jgi:hypothetical protein
VTWFLRRQRPPYYLGQPLRERRRVGQRLAADDAGLVEQQPGRLHNRVGAAVLADALGEADDEGALRGSE